MVMNNTGYASNFFSNLTHDITGLLKNRVTGLNQAWVIAIASSQTMWIEIGTLMN